jgi:hypothetical protein
MRVLDDLCDVLEKELEQLVRKPEMTPGELDNAYKAVDILKDIETIKAMKENSYDGYSQRMYYDEPMSSYGRSYDGRGGSYDSYDYSGARRGRDGDGDGRYSERGMSNRPRYSGHDEKEQLMSKIEDMKRQLDQMK